MLGLKLIYVSKGAPRQRNGSLNKGGQTTCRIIAQAGVPPNEGCMGYGTDLLIIYMATLSTWVASPGFPSPIAIFAELWCFPCYWPEQGVEQTVEMLEIWNIMTLLWSHCSMTVDSDSEAVTLIRFHSKFTVIT